jgi:hypothetical protein
MGRWKTRLLFVLALLAAAAFIGAVGLLMFRPAKIVGVSESGLVASIGSTSEVFDQSCDEQEATWDCRVYLGGKGGGTTRLTVAIDDYGCWEAWPGKPTKAKTDKEPDRSGCISIFDLVF